MTEESREQFLARVLMALCAKHDGDVIVSMDEVAALPVGSRLLIDRDRVRGEIRIRASGPASDTIEIEPAARERAWQTIERTREAPVATETEPRRSATLSDQDLAAIESRLVSRAKQRQAEKIQRETAEATRLLFSAESQRRS